jgi:plastocyanin
MRRGEEGIVNTRAVASALAIVAVLASAPAAAADTTTVKGRGRDWRPAKVRIDRGDRVRWRGVSGTHTVRAWGGNWSFSERLRQGESVKRRFRSRGTFRFFCSIHGSVGGGMCSGMCGRVRVG